MLNGAQMHELNKFIGTVTTLAVVGVVVYCEVKQSKNERDRQKRKNRMTLINVALDKRDKNMFDKIVKEF
ncbi:MAG: hypothetical protein JWO15_3662 [Sphingomonadales bacterium]|nr:hypothetical protein [Sphingomonadales bacterium]